MKSSIYCLTFTTASRCGKCNAPVSLLMHRLNGISKPVFWICWTCKSVFESGKGEVRS